MNKYGLVDATFFGLFFIHFTCIRPSTNQQTQILIYLTQFVSKIYIPISKTCTIPSDCEQTKEHII